MTTNLKKTYEAAKLVVLDVTETKSGPVLAETEGVFQLPDSPALEFGPVETDIS